MGPIRLNSPSLVSLKKLVRFKCSLDFSFFSITDIKICYILKLSATAIILLKLYTLYTLFNLVLRLKLFVCIFPMRMGDCCVVFRMRILSCLLDTNNIIFFLLF